jgi:hypothetical protein
MRIFNTNHVSKTQPNIVVFQNQKNFTDGALFHLLPKIVDYEGNSPLKRSEVVLISPPFQDLKFSIFRANA